VSNRVAQPSAAAPSLTPCAAAAIARCCYAENVPHTEICSTTLDEKDAELFAFAVRQPLRRVTVFATAARHRHLVRCVVGQVSNHYWYQMYIDGLPIWGMVGEVRVRSLGWAVVGRSL
jgi:hypothetical protein